MQVDGTVAIQDAVCAVFAGGPWGVDGWGLGGCVHWLEQRRLFSLDMYPFGALGKEKSCPITECGGQDLSLVAAATHRQ